MEGALAPDDEPDLVTSPPIIARTAWLSAESLGIVFIIGLGAALSLALVLAIIAIGIIGLSDALKGYTR